MLSPDCSEIGIKLKNVTYKFDTASEYHEASRWANGLIYYVKGGHHHEYGETCDTRAGDLLILPYKGSYTSTLLEKGTEYYQIDFEIIENSKSVSLYDQPKVIYQPESSRYFSLIKEIYDAYIIQNNAYQITCVSKIMTIISILLTETHGEDENSKDIKRIMKTVTYINEHFYENESLEFLASISSTCVSNLEKLFRKCFGLSPIAYRNMVRIEHAKALLDGGFNINEAAQKTGFNDYYYFSRMFKKITGTTPGKYNHKFEEGKIDG